MIKLQDILQETPETLMFNQGVLFMKFGVADYGLSVWDGELYDLQTRLEDLKAIGYDGIERLTAASPSDAMRQAEIYHRLGMDFSTVAGPKVANGIAWTCALGKPYVWLTPGPATRDVNIDIFCRRANRMVEVANKMNVEVAVHNHLGAVVEQQEELDKFMKDVPGAKLILDIGHLQGAGGDCVGTIEKYADRIIAMHFKDIEMLDPDNKEWYKRLCFRGLDDGNINFDWRASVRALKKVGYDKWCFIEQDTHRADAHQELAQSLNLLKKAFAEE